MTADTRFVLCATPRSGSTMICEDFANNPGLGLPNEHFLAAVRSWRKDGIRFDPDEIMSKGTDETGHQAVKIMATHARLIDAALKDHWRLGFLPHFRRYFQQAQWVRIRRRERDRQALSRIRAERSGIFHARSGSSKLNIQTTNTELAQQSEDPALTFNAELKARLTREIETITNEEAIWDKFFKSWKISPFEIVYEDVAQAETNYLQALGKRHGLQLADTLSSRSLKRLSDTRSEAIIQSFRQEVAPEIWRFNSD